MKESHLDEFGRLFSFRSPGSNHFASCSLVFVLRALLTCQGSPWSIGAPRFGSFLNVTVESGKKIIDPEVGEQGSEESKDGDDG